MTAYLPKNLPLTIAATLPKTTRCPDKSLRCKAFRASFTLSAAGHIAPGDAAALGDLALGEGEGAGEAVAQDDDLPLTGVQAALDRPAHPGACLLQVQLLQHGVVHPQNVHEGQAAGLLVALQRVGERHLPLELAPGAKVHQDLIFNAPAAIGGQLHLLGGVEGGHPLDEPDGTDGNEVVLVGGLGVVLLHDMGHQAEVMLHQGVAGLHVPLGKPLQALPFLLRLQWPGKGPGGTGQAQGEHKAVEH